MTELLSKFKPGEIIGLVAVAGGLLIPILCGVTAIITDRGVARPPYTDSLPALAGGRGNCFPRE